MDGTSSEEKSQLVQIELPGLSAGDYLILIKADMTSGQNPFRKLVTSIYSKDPIEIKRVPASPGIHIMQTCMSQWLMIRKEYGHDYQVPAFAL